MSDKNQSSNYDSDNKHQYARNFFEYELTLNNNLANGIEIINYLKCNGFDESDLRLQKLFKLLKHTEHILVYGNGNERRLTGKHETASINNFSYGVANRGASIRIPRQSEKDGKGYFEDRRPASNMDPYVVTSRLMKTILLNED